MSENTEVKTKKNTSWSYENMVLTANFPSGKVWSVDLKAMSEELTDSAKEKIFQYGIRQYLSDDVATSKDKGYTENEKITVFNQSIEDMKANTYWKRSGKQTEKISKYKTEVDVKAAAEAVGVSFEIAKRLLESQGFVIR